MAEPAILIGYAVETDAYSYTDDGVPMERKPLRPGEVWINYDAVPDTPPAPSPWPGTAAALTTGVLAEPLVATADPLRFTTAPASRLSLVLPGNMRAAAYRAQLQDAAGRSIPYDPSVWVVDGIEQLVAFKVKTPAQLGYQTPLSLTYWIYTGDIAGASPITSVANVGAGPGQVFESTVAGVVQLRTIAGDGSGVGVATVGDVVRVTNEVTGANLGAGAGVFAQKSGATLEMRSLVADAGVGAGGISITQAATEIAVGNTLTGANLGAGPGTMFASKTGNTLQFNSLTGTSVTGVTVSAPAGGVITLANTMIGQSLGGGTAIFSAKVGSVLQFNTITGSSTGTSVSLVGNLITIDNTLTGQNFGVGEQVFIDKSGNFLRFRGLRTTTTSGLLVATSVNDITTRVNIGTWIVSDQKATGTAGGDSTSLTLHTRTLNTITSTGAGPSSVTLAANAITFAAGRYFVYGTVPNRAGDGVMAGLYNSAGTLVLNGSSAFNSGATATTPCTFCGVVTAADTYTVRQYVTTGRASDGLGAAASVPGAVEVYTMVTIIQMSDS